MAGKRVFTPLRITSLIVALGLVAAPLGLSTGWAARHDQRSMSSTTQTRTMERQGPMGTPAPSTVLLERSPGTIDEYAAYVQDRVQVAAMQLRQRGTAELRITIGKDGSIRQTEVVEVSGAPTLRDDLTTLVNRIAPLPPLPGNADVLVVTTDLAFDYPGENLYDRFGRLSRFPG
ncbi:MAG: TonB family protein [Candidatus Entotheonellia bacterium]